MAFSEELAERIRQGLARRQGIEEKKMFGGIGFLLNGNLLVGVWKDSLIVRLGPEEGEEALKEPHVKDFDITGRAMKGWVVVAQEGVGSDDRLRGWIQRAVKFVGKLPAKEWGHEPNAKRKRQDAGRRIVRPARPGTRPGQGTGQGFVPGLECDP